MCCAGCTAAALAAQSQLLWGPVKAEVVRGAHQAGSAPAPSSLTAAHPAPARRAQVSGDSQNKCKSCALALCRYPEMYMLEGPPFRADTSRGVVYDRSQVRAGCSMREGREGVGWGVQGVSGGAGSAAGDAAAGALGGGRTRFAGSAALMHTPPHTAPARHKGFTAPPDDPPTHPPARLLPCSPR